MGQASLDCAEQETAAGGVLQDAWAQRGICEAATEQSRLPGLPVPG